MNIVLLISEQTVKKYTVVSDNVDSKYIYNTIRQVQSIDLDTIIGPALNKKLQSLVEEGSIREDVNKHYKELLDEYITPYMCAKIQADVQVYINYKLTNSGTIQNQDEHRAPIGFKEGRSLIEQYNNVAAAYGTKLKYFLDNNCNHYPEYKKVIDFQTSEEQPLCSIFLGNRTDRLNYIGK